jgi:hypothetical protein
MKEVVGGGGSGYYKIPNEEKGDVESKHPEEKPLHSKISTVLASGAKTSSLRVCHYLNRLFYAEANTYLSQYFNTHGLSETLPILESMSDTRVLKKQRFNSINPLPEKRDGEYLHIHRIVGAESSDLPIQGNLKDMMEPSFEKILTADGISFTVMEILDMDTKDLTFLPQKFSEYKKSIDSFYKGKLYINLPLENNPMVLTVPTKRYMPGQFIAITHPRQMDILLAQDLVGLEKFKKYLEVSPSGSKTIHGERGNRLTNDEKKSIRTKIKKGAEIDMIVPNIGNISSMAEIAKDLPNGSFVGQNSMDVSSDKTCQHFQICTNVKEGLIPLFNIGGEKILESSLFKVYKMDPNKFCGPVYKFISSSNTKEVRKLLEKIYNVIQEESFADITASLVVNKTKDGLYEFYFILRNCIDKDETLKNKIKRMNLSNPGWLEMIGVRIASNKTTFTDVPDEIWREEILKPLTISEDQSREFEDRTKAILHTPF